MAHVQTEMEKELTKKELAKKLEITIDVAPSITDVVKKLQPNPERQEETMCRIPCELIHANDGGVSDYKPRYISIGPYHWRAYSMQNVKLEYLQDLLQRGKGKNTVETYMDEIRKVCPSERRKYHEFDTCRISSDDEFCKMLVLNGCFLVELLLKRQEGSGTFPGLDVHKLNRDLMLIENQISFSVLERIYEKTHLQNKVSLFDLAVSYLHSKKEENVNPYKKVENVEHLLHLLYICRTNRLELKSPKPKVEIWKVILYILVINVGIVGIFTISVHIVFDTSSHVSKSVSDGLSKGFYILFAVTGLLSLLFSGSLAYYFLRGMLPFISYILVRVMFLVIFLVETLANQKTEHIEPVIPTVKEIKYAGIRWAKKISKKTPYKMFLVKWPVEFLTVACRIHAGSMEISENSFSEFENLLFYEQIYFLPRNPVTDEISKDNIFNISTYALYMRNLVETEMDIHFLKKQGVLTSTTSFIEDKEVTRFFRKQRPWMVFNVVHQQKIHGQFELLKKFCYEGHAKRKTKLREEYFVSPLVIFTFIGFLLILVLTALQTVYTMLGHYKKDD